MKKWIAGIAAAAALAMGSASAGTIENSFGNTLRVTQPNGSVVNYHFEANGTFMAHAGEQMISGAWRNDGENVCLTPQGQPEACYPAGNYGVGDSWELDGGDGTAATLTIVQGR